MRTLGIQGARRGKPFKKVVYEELADRPMDLVQRL